MDINTANIIREITPAELREFHIRHDYLHELIPDRDHIVFQEREYRDFGCRKCYGIPESYLYLKCGPLRTLEQYSFLIPSKRTYDLFEGTSFNTSSSRKWDLIQQVLYNCHYKEYPAEWDNVSKALNSYINGKYDYQTNQETYLPRLEEEEKEKIKTDLIEEIRMKYREAMVLQYQDSSGEESEGQTEGGQPRNIPLYRRLSIMTYDNEENDGASFSGVQLGEELTRQQELELRNFTDRLLGNRLTK